MVFAVLLGASRGSVTSEAMSAMSSCLPPARGYDMGYDLGEVLESLLCERADLVGDR